MRNTAPFDPCPLFVNLLNLPAMKKILVLADWHDLEQLCKSILDTPSYLVSIVHTGRELYRHLARKTPDLIIVHLDLDLDEHAADRILRGLKSTVSWKNIPLLLLSSDEDKLQQHKVFGKTVVIDTPFNKHSASIRIRSLLKRTHA